MWASGMVVLCGALTATSAPGYAASHAARPDTDAQPSWEPCLDLDSSADLQCAEVTVPLDHSGEVAGSLRLAVARVAAREHSETTLLVHPGGPGMPARESAATLAAQLPAGLRDTVDVVAFDPRGTGASEPELSCDPEHFAAPRTDPVPADEAAATRLLLDKARYTLACARAHGATLRHMGSVQSVHDTEAVRRALAVPRVDYLGYSYGAYIGAGYAAHYPQRLRRLVMDSPLHPDTNWYEASLARRGAARSTAEPFFAWIAQHHDDYGLGSTPAQVRRSYHSTRVQLSERPAARQLGPGELDATFTVAAYETQSWPALAHALSELVHQDDPTALLWARHAWADPSDDDGDYAAALATRCADSPWPRDSAQWLRQVADGPAAAPLHTPLFRDAPCRYWPVEGGFWMQVHGFETADALLVHAEDDGPAPVSGSVAMRERFPDSRLVWEVDSPRHGVTFDGNTCVDEVVTAYLARGELPEAGPGGGEPDLRCDPPPLPSPTPERATPNPLHFGSAGR